MDSTSHSSTTYPLDTAVHIPNQDVIQKGYINSIPIDIDSDKTSYYTDQLQDGESTTIPADVIDSFIPQQPTKQDITLPSWIYNDTKVRLTIGQITHQGRLIKNTHNEWSFIQRNRQGQVIKTSHQKFPLQIYTTH